MRYAGRRHLDGLKVKIMLRTEGGLASVNDAERPAERKLVTGSGQPTRN